jgi:outer membrane protein
MKNGLLIWNVVLTLLVGYLLIAKFSGKKKINSVTRESNSTDSTMNSEFRVAYFEMDSVATKFEEVKQLKSELSKKEEDNNKELNSLTQQYRERYNYYQKKAEEGTLTEAQSVTAGQEMQQMEDNIKNRKLKLEQDYNDFYMRRQNDIKSKIEAFIREYNKDGKYTYVVSDDPGLFYFKDVRYNITADVIAGLNKLYPPKKAK